MFGQNRWNVGNLNERSLIKVKKTSLKYRLGNRTMTPKSDAVNFDCRSVSLRDISFFTLLSTCY
jgi:hypothetical protein